MMHILPLSRIGYDLLPSFPYPGRCIYCQSEGTSNKHIIPRAFGGKLIIRNGSCGDCQKVTSEFERIVSREIYWNFRLRLGIDGSRKHKHERPTHWRATLKDGDEAEEVLIDVRKFPLVYITAEFAPPGITTGATPHSNNPEMKLEIKGNAEEIATLLTDFNARTFAPAHYYPWAPFTKMIAKISHAYAVALIGLSGVEFLLPPLILGSSTHLAHLVGGVSDVTETLSPPNNLALGLREIDGQNYVFARTKILGDGRFPTYEAIVGRVIDLEHVVEKIT